MFRYEISDISYAMLGVTLCFLYVITSTYGIWRQQRRGNR